MCDLRCSDCVAVNVAVWKKEVGGKGGGEKVSAKLKSYSVGQAAVKLLALNLFFLLVQKIQILIN